MVQRVSMRCVVWLATAMILIAAPSAQAAIAVGNRSQSVVFTGSGTTSTSVTISATSPVFAAIDCQSGSITSVNWNTSETFTAISTKSDGIAVDFVAIYGLKNPTTGTHNIDILAASVGGCVAQFITTTGGDTTTGWRSVFTRNESNGTGPGLTVTDSQNGDLVLHGADVLANPIAFDGGEDVTSTQTNDIAGNTLSGGLSTKAAVGSNTVVGCTDQPNYSEIAFAVIPAGGGGGSACGARALTGVGCDAF